MTGFRCFGWLVALLCALGVFFGALYGKASQGVEPPVGIRLDYVRTADNDLTLVVTITPESGYYTYAYNATTGRPTQLTLMVAGEPRSAEIRYPHGMPHKDVFSGQDVPAYTGAVSVFVRLPQTGAASTRVSGFPAPEDLAVQVSLLLCSSAHCIPVFLTVPLPPLPDQIPALDSSPWQHAWRTAVPVTLAVSPGRVAAAQSGKSGASSVPFTSLTGKNTPPAGTPLPLLSWNTVTAGQAAQQKWAFVPQSDAAAEPVSLGPALLWGLLAGLILNVMPCVLPVITLKLSTLLGAAADRASLTDPARLRRFREHNLFFAAGILSWFAVLAAAVSGLDMTWGGLFQHAWAVGGLAALIGVLGMSMLGLCTLPVIDLKAGISGSPRSQAYATGLTATLLATPCSGPLLGGVLAWSSLQPPLIVLLVFLSTGVGMAAPYLLFALYPRTVRLLPRPGAWLGWLERGVGGLLLATCVYLLSLLPASPGIWLAVALTGLAAVYIWRQAKIWRRSTGSLVRQWAAALACLGLVVWLLVPGASGQQTQDLWEPFTPAAFRAVLGNEPVLLEFTADWCPNCKVLEATTLNPARLRAWRSTYGLRLMRVDMTAHDPDQESLLRALGSISIPLTAIFPAGAGAERPLVLRDVYTPQRLEQALERTIR